MKTVKKIFAKELEEFLGVERRTIYYWEKKGKIPPAKRTPMGNYRYWTEADLKEIKEKLGQHGNVPAR